MTSQITPFLMFEGAAEAAMDFYVGLFADGQVLEKPKQGASKPSQ